MYAVNAAKSEEEFCEKETHLANNPTADVSYLWVTNGSLSLKLLANGTM
jgi:hypothetical protein